MFPGRKIFIFILFLLNFEKKFPFKKINQNRPAVKESAQKINLPQK